ncbi:MAG: cytochrome c biogenesis protein ResB [Bacteroidales bacterium]|nr:cytochrome c biogenesis protein ResB [Bacteroidales bacterium]
MWKKPWRYREGFLIGGGLLAIGTILQCTTGAVEWELFAWPVNLIVLLLFMLAIAIIYAMHKKVYALGWMMQYHAAIPALIYAMALTIVMGLTVQTSDGGIPWLSQMLSFWPFVLIYTWMTLIAGLVTIRRAANFKMKEIPFLLNHLGVFMAITFATLGYADMHKLKMTVKTGTPEWRATDDNNAIHEPGLAIELHKFILEEYPPKVVLVDNETGKVVHSKDNEGWDIEILSELHDAAPVNSEDGQRYEHWHSPGSTCAMEIRARRGNIEKKGWISSGSFVFPHTPMNLDERYSLAMPEREPKRYASEITVYTQKGETIKGTVEVNKPLKVDGWKIYQYSYDSRLGKWSTTSIFELVKDPWLPFVYAGIYMMLAGALCLLFVMAPKPIKTEN